MPRHNRKAASATGMLIVAALSLLLSAAGAAKADRIVVVRSGDDEPYRKADVAVSVYLRERGYDTRSVGLAELNDRPESSAMADADGVCALGSQAAHWLHRNLEADKPLTYCMVTDPAAAGLTTGRGAWGVNTSVPAARQFELIAEAMPKARRIGVLHSGVSAASGAAMAEANAAVPAGWSIVAVDIDKHDSFAAATAALLEKDVDIVWTCPDSAVYNAASVRMLLLSALRRRTPVFGFSTSFVRAGAVVGTGLDPAQQGRQAGELTEKLMVLKRSGGVVTPHIQESPRFQIALNQIVAGRLPMKISPALIEQATVVFRQEDRP